MEMYCIKSIYPELKWLYIHNQIHCNSVTYKTEHNKQCFIFLFKLKYCQ